MNNSSHVEQTGIINKPLLLRLVSCQYYLYQWCTVKQISDNEIYLLIKYIKSFLWRVAKRLSYIEDARCLKVKDRQYIHGKNKTVHAVFTPTQITQVSQYLALGKRRIVPEKEHFWAEGLLISRHHLVDKDTNWTRRFNSEYSVDN